MNLFLILLILPTYCHDINLFLNDPRLEIHQETPVYYDANSAEVKLCFKLLNLSELLDYSKTMSFTFPYFSAQELQVLYAIAIKHRVSFDDGFDDNLVLIEAPEDNVFDPMDYDLSE